MKCITEAVDLKGKRVFVRGSLNEPVDDGVIRDDFRLKKMQPVITFLQNASARIILAGHLSGDPSDHTLEPMAKYFDVPLIKNPLSDAGRSEIDKLENGDVVMLENLRIYEGETTNDESFASDLATLTDIYVNENFSAAHREHASIVRLPTLLPSYMGIQFEQEYSYLSQALNPPLPSLIIIGGAKPETKLPLARHFLNAGSKVFVGGLSANEFFVARGYSVGTSVVSGKDLGVEELMDHPNLILPKDVHVLCEDGTTQVKLVTEVEDTERIVDVGPDTLVSIASIISESSFIVWNGPLGDSDRGFLKGSEHLVRLIADSNAQSIVGGGDTVAAVSSFGIEDRLTFVSTAGSAMVTFLATGTLPGIEALS